MAGATLQDLPSGQRRTPLRPQRDELADEKRFWRFSKPFYG